MKIVLATGIYPPEIGGPATYVRALEDEFHQQKIDVRVLTYARKHQTPNTKHHHNIVRVPIGLPLVRWFRYARALRRLALDADVIIAFSSVSCGVPLCMAKLTKPKKILRLGGDFFWERYTDHGGMKSLREWYVGVTGYWLLVTGWMMKLLQSFDYIVFSTRFQEEIYEEHYTSLPSHSVIENALPSGMLYKHERHEPFRLLCMGRFVGFKNLPALMKAVNGMEGVTLTLVGDGPMRSKLQKIAGENVSFRAPLHGDEKEKVLIEHDLLVISSITEISPNVALEARASGLPVLLTQETGLSKSLTDGMVIRDLSSSEKITEAIREVMEQYGEITECASRPVNKRGWKEVADEWLSLIS
jgi:glycosyltransferase involved in cell wall biosynthesis